jgi:hypothetical protein
VQDWTANYTEVRKLLPPELDFPDHIWTAYSGSLVWYEPEQVFLYSQRLSHSYPGSSVDRAIRSYIYLEARTRDGDMKPLVLQSRDGDISLKLPRIVDPFTPVNAGEFEGPEDARITLDENGDPVFMYSLRIPCQISRSIFMYSLFQQRLVQISFEEGNEYAKNWIPLFHKKNFYIVTNFVDGLNMGRCVKETGKCKRHHPVDNFRPFASSELRGGSTWVNWNASNPDLLVSLTKNHAEGWVYRPRITLLSMKNDTPRVIYLSEGLEFGKVNLNDSYVPLETLEPRWPGRDPPMRRETIITCGGFWTFEDETVVLLSVADSVNLMVRLPPWIHFLEKASVDCESLNRTSQETIDYVTNLELERSKTEPPSNQTFSIKSQKLET